MGKVWEIPIDHSISLDTRCIIIFRTFCGYLHQVIFSKGTELIKTLTEPRCQSDQEFIHYLKTLKQNLRQEISNVILLIWQLITDKIYGFANNWWLYVVLLARKGLELRGAHPGSGSSVTFDWNLEMNSMTGISGMMKQTETKINGTKKTSHWVGAWPL